MSMIILIKIHQVVKIIMDPCALEVFVISLETIIKTNRNESKICPCYIKSVKL